MKSKLTWLEIILLLAPFIAIAIYWPQLPTRVPVHWGLHGEVNGWMPKWPGLLLPPLLAAATVIFLRFLQEIDPKLLQMRDAPGRMGAALQITRLALLVLFDLITYLQIVVSLGSRVNVTRIVLSATLLFLAVVGNYLGNLRPNYFFGIRTPWTLENPQTWRATHRLGGRLIFFGALLLFILQFFLSGRLFMVLFIAASLALVLWAFAYSWRYSRQRVGQN